MPFRPLSVLLVLMALAAGPALAQVPDKAAAELDAAKTTIDRVDARLGRGELDDASLQQFRGEIDPVAGRMNALANDLAPRIAAVKDRLAQLGPKPDDKGGASEAPAITSERGAQQTLFDDLDATAKRARVLVVQAGQVSDTIVARRRALFAHALFKRSASLASPNLWAEVVAEAPGDLASVAALARNWGQVAYDGLSVGSRIALGSLLALIALGYYPAWRVAVRVRSRDPGARPSRFHKGIAALRVAAATAVVPVAAALALGALVVVFDLPNLLEPIGTSLTISIAVVAVGTGLARGVMAPKSPNWRLPAVSDFTARTVYHLTITVTAIVATEHVAEAVNDLIKVGVPAAIATRGLGAMAVAVAIVLALRRSWLRRHAAAARDEPADDHWGALLRASGRAVAAALLVAVLIGYVALAAFLVEQIIDRKSVV